ncbi:MAG: DEAD/DEAH box helicase family protein [Gammaproteobacteria bacterium]|nr:DEAD/DEAH box helicase family protein [Gammaproteobacteria bacterium]
MTLDEILSKWRTERAAADYSRQRALGDAFERLCIAYLTHDPEQKTQYRRVMTREEWAREKDKDARDIGIDLVAQTLDGHFVAVQCKCWEQGRTIPKSEIDSFLAASGTKDFTHRILIDTTGREWSNNLERTLSEQVIPVIRIGLHHLQKSPINWGEFVETNDIRYEHKPLVLRPHQENALRRVVDGLQETGSRGKLIMACGTGKTLTALRIAEQMVGNGGRILYLVPSLALMSQTIHAWTKDANLTLRAFAVCSDSQVGKRKKNQGDNIDMDALDLAWPATTDAAKLSERARPDDPNALTVFFATYQSSPVIERSQKEFGLPGFDLAICDEAHRTAGAIVDEEEQSNFTRIHRDSCIHACRRLYMTATPKVYSESARSKAGELATALCSMDDNGLYGPVLYEIGFAAAVEQDLLSDYRVIVLTVPENLAAKVLKHFGGEFGDTLKVDDTALMIGCWRALAKADKDIFPENECTPMKRAIAFCRTIKSSEQLEDLIESIGKKYRLLAPVGDATLPDHDAPARHIDGTHNADRRAEALKWLDSPGENECRILTNARCLTEGVDLPALDGILFMHPRKSQIEVVQAVGRVMRKAPGKQMGYIILPVVVAPGASAEDMLNDNERWRKVWQMLNAIRSHDDGFDAELNRIEMGEDPKRIAIITVADWKAEGGDSTSSDGPSIGHGSGESDSGAETSSEPGGQTTIFDDLPGAIMAKIVEKCGSRKYWDEWAGDVAKIARAHIARITAMVTVDETNEGNPDIRAAAEMFDGFVKELQDDLNSGITRENAIEMLAQHMVTGPVFDALFEAEAFTKRNPVSQAMQNMLDVIKPSGIDAEAENLEDFYASVKRRARGASSEEAKQQIIAELYDKFFRNAFAETSKALGIVYTPVEVVDFILRSTEQVLHDELGASLSDRGVNILDPFTGTGTFITRLLQSGLVKDEDIERKFDHEIHANEIVLLAYYIAAVNIESVFHAKTGRDYRPFKHICLADTFQMGEEAAQTSLIKDSLKENSDRRSGQKDLDIRVIVGNPPWMAGKKEPGYPELYKEIEETYAALSTVTNKTSLYDSYKLAIRWASVRIGDQGVIGFVTNGSWIQGNVDSGIRACLAEEFSSIYVVDLRGNQRTSGELSRREGGKVFGSGSRAPVAIMILVKDPLAFHEGCRILYRDIGDYLSLEDKLEKLVKWDSIAAINDWQEIQPDKNDDWINKREEGFDELLPLGSKSVKSGKVNHAVFRLYSRGYATSRDAYLYNFSLDSCDENAQLMIDDYKAALEALSDSPTANEVELVSRRFAKNIHWERELKNNLTRRKKVDFSSGHIWKIQYRPFVKQYCYVDYTLVSNKYQQNLIFPEVETENRAICLPGVGSTRPFSLLMVDHMPDLHFIAFGQCFPRYRFKELDETNQGSLPETEHIGERLDNITDYVLDQFQSHYKDPKITKDGIFNYVYGLLHAPDFREAFPNSLSKELPRIPMASDFWAFADAGHMLGNLHVGYEYCPEYSLELEFSGNGKAEPRHFKLGTKAMRYGENEGEKDKSILIVNEYIRLIGIPDEAHGYMVNGRTPLDWLIDRYKITTDKKSGKVNDPNAWFEKPEDLISTIRRIVHLSVETTRIVRSLPKALSKFDPK